MLDRIFSLVRVSRKLVMGKNATLVVTSTTGTETELDMAELAALNGISATELGYIDGVTAGTVLASKAVVVDSNKDASALRNLTLTNLDAGASGTAGTVDVFPTTASKGKLILSAVANDGDTNVTLTNAAMAQASVISIPDPGAATANVLLTSAANDQAVVTATSVELNYNDITTLGTLAASKTWTSDASLDTIMPTGGLLTVQSGGGVTLNSGSTLEVSGTFNISTVAVTASAAELNYNDIATLGTLAASKAWTSDASLDTVMPTGGLLTVQSGGAVTLNSGSTMTISGAVVQAPVFVADATPYTVLAADSGKLHIILEQTNSITLNLPVIAAGLSYKFVMGGVATEAQNWVIVATTPSFYNGGVSWDDSNAVASPVPVYGNGTSHLTLTATTPEAGTAIEIYSNGTEWFVCGAVFSTATPAFT